MSKLTNEIMENTHIEEVTEPMEDIDMVEEEVIEEEPFEEEEPMEEESTNLPNNVISLDMSEAARTKIWVNGDCTKVIELNLTDMGIMSRYSDAYPKLLDLQDEIQRNIADSKPEEMETMEELSEFATQFKSIDTKMREYVDFIFDGKVSDVCCDGGSMYDPVAGGFWRFEYIIDKIGKLYNQQFGKEMKANEKRMAIHTNKYTGNPERRSGKGKYTKKYPSRK